jgi:hypothetical protein
MTTKNRFSLFAIVTIFVLVLSLLTPAIAFADDGTPPVPTEEPVSPPTEEVVDETAPSEEEPTVAEVLEELPEGTEIVVVNEEGEAVPLATEEAAEIIVSGDPMWCPTGVQPGGAGCTSAFVVFNDGIGGGLLPFLQANAGIYTGAGTIYVATDYDSSLEGGSIIINSGDGYGLTDLTIQGGWDFVNNTQGVASTINRDLQVINWGSNVTLKDLIFGDSGTSSNIDVFTTGDILLDNVESSNNSGGFGADLDGDAVTIQDSQFLNNSWHGIVASANGPLTLTNVYANGNNGTGALLDGDDDLTITDGTFNDNGTSGISASSSAGDITLNDVTARRNDNDGAYLDNSGGSGDITLTGTNEFINNDGDGLEAYTNGDIGLNNVTANRNGNSGAWLNNSGGSGNIDLTGTNEFNNNVNFGLYAVSSGDITLHDVQANRNDDESGAYLDNSGGSGDVTLTGTNVFNNNGGYGLDVTAGDDIHVNNVTANRNSEDGAYLETCGCTGDSDIVLTGTNEFNNNDGNGLYAGTDGDIQVNSITASRNGEDGAYLGGSGDLKLTGTNVFNNNDAVGLYVEMGGDVTLNTVTAYYNYYNGAWVDNTYGSGNVSIYNSNFDYNVEDPTNGYSGLNVDSNGFVTLSNVSASNNGGDGANIGYYAGGWSGVLVQNSVFNDNYDYAGDGWGYGLYIDNGSGKAILKNVTGLDNDYNGLYINTTGNVIINSSDFSNTYDDDGAELDVDGNVLICNSTFSDNDSYGLDADDVDGDLTLSDVTFGGNGSGDYDYGGSGTVTVTSGGNCIPSGGGKKDPGVSLPLHLVPVNDAGTPVELDCELFSGTVLILNNGDSITFKCPIPGSATLGSLTSDGLPGALPESMEYVSGMGAGQNPDGNDKALSGLVILSFIIPEGVDPAGFAILYWNGSEWVDLKDAKFEDGREVTSGGFNNGNGYFEAIVNFSGNFVLVTK